MTDLQLDLMIHAIYEALPDNPIDAMEVLAACMAATVHATGHTEQQAIDLLKSKIARIASREIEIRQ